MAMYWTLVQWVDGTGFRCQLWGMCKWKIGKLGPWRLENPSFKSFIIPISQAYWS
jgi:hypothetical protein